MSDQNVITREQFEKMTPERVLAGGFRDASGKPREELKTIWATAGAMQLESVNPRELDVMVSAIEQVAPLHHEPMPEQYRNTIEEAAEVTYGILGAQVDPTLVEWLNRFTPAVRNEQDVNDLVTHLTAVARQHALFAGMTESKPA